MDPVETPVTPLTVPAPEEPKPATDKSPKKFDEFATLKKLKTTFDEIPDDDTRIRVFGWLANYLQSQDDPTQPTQGGQPLGFDGL